MSDEDIYNNMTREGLSETFSRRCSTCGVVISPEEEMLFQCGLDDPSECEEATNFSIEQFSEELFGEGVEMSGVAELNFNED